MTFASPMVLAALLLLPALVAWYVALERGRGRAAEAFVTPALRASVAPAQPGWRRHVPLVAFALAIAVLVLAAARPSRTVAVIVERAAIVLATDVSGSMEAEDVAPDRLAAAQLAAEAFVAEVPRGVRVGVVAFNQVPTVLQAPTADRAQVGAALERLRASGGTATGEAISESLRIISAIEGEEPPAAIVLLSDGKSTSGVDPVTQAIEAGERDIPIYTVALGTANGTIEVPRRDGSTVTRAVPPDPRALAAIADASGGETFTAADAEGLNTVYERLGSQLGRKDERRELTAGFAASGLALLLIGAVLSLRFFGRLI